jgi:hypothetical protein
VAIACGVADIGTSIGWPGTICARSLDRREALPHRLRGDRNDGAPWNARKTMR